MRARARLDRVETIVIVGLGVTFVVMGVAGILALIR